MEDPTRVCRGIQFDVRCGFQVAQDTLQLLNGTVQMVLFQRRSSARLGEELRLWLAESEACKAVAHLAELALLRFIQAAVSATAAERALGQQLGGGQ